jgi:hypothetical protein
MDRPKIIELQHMADMTAVAVGKAFEPDEFGSTERLYTMELMLRLYRYPGSPLTTYGMKLHPKKALSDPDYG